MGDVIHVTQCGCGHLRTHVDERPQALPLVHEAQEQASVRPCGWCSRTVWVTGNNSTPYQNWTIVPLSVLNCSRARPLFICTTATSSVTSNRSPIFISFPHSPPAAKRLPTRARAGPAVLPRRSARRLRDALTPWTPGHRGGS